MGHPALKAGPQLDRQPIRITTVDPAQRIVEGVLKDGAPIRVMVSDTPVIFRWPVEGENWTVVRRANQWFLETGFEDANESFSITDLQPGEAKISSDVIYDKAGNRMITANVLNPEWTDIPLVAPLAAHASDHYSPQYRLVGNRVELRGSARNFGGIAFASGTQMWNGGIPVELRPALSMPQLGFVNGVYAAYFLVDQTGSLSCQQSIGAGVLFAFNGIFWDLS